MLYDTIRNEGAMQKEAGDWLSKADQLVGNGFDRLSRHGALVASSPHLGLGALVGGLTNDGNRAAGAIGGAAGGYIGAGVADLGLLALALAGKKTHLLTKLPHLSFLASGALGNVAGSYLGGKLGAKFDRATGSNITHGVNKLLGRE